MAGERVRVNTLYEDFTFKAIDIPYQINPELVGGWTSIEFNTEDIWDAPIYLNNTAGWFDDCFNLKEVDFSDVDIIDTRSSFENIANMFNNCTNLIRIPYGILSDNVVDMTNAFAKCGNLNDFDSSYYIGSNVVNANYAFYRCVNMKKAPTCGDNVMYANNTYADCHNIVGAPQCGENVIDACNMYAYCYNITDAPQCGDNVIDASYMYTHCYNLNDIPKCGKNVVNANSMYRSCSNLIGSPQCSSFVNDASYMYAECTNIIGAPNVGEGVKSAIGMYLNCFNLNEAPILSPCLENALAMYLNCYNLKSGDLDFTTCDPNISKNTMCLLLGGAGKDTKEDICFNITLNYGNNLFYSAVDYGPIGSQINMLDGIGVNAIAAPYNKDGAYFAFDEDDNPYMYYFAQSTIDSVTYNRQVNVFVKGEATFKANNAPTSDANNWNISNLRAMCQAVTGPCKWYIRERIV